MELKEIDVTLYEIDKQQLLKIQKEIQVLVYNTLTNTYSIEWTCSKKSIFYSKYASDYLVYFLFEKLEVQNEK